VSPRPSRPHGGDRGDTDGAAPRKRPKRPAEDRQGTGNVFRAAKPAKPAADICWDGPVAAQPDEAAAAIAHTANERGREGVVHIRLKGLASASWSGPCQQPIRHTLDQAGSNSAMTGVDLSAVLIGAGISGLSFRESN